MVQKIKTFNASLSSLHKLNFVYIILSFQICRKKRKIVFLTNGKGILANREQVRGCHLILCVAGRVNPLCCRMRPLENFFFSFWNVDKLNLGAESELKMITKGKTESHLGFGDRRNQSVWQFWGRWEAVIKKSIPPR